MLIYHLLQLLPASVHWIEAMLQSGQDVEYCAKSVPKTQMAGVFDEAHTDKSVHVRMCATRAVAAFILTATVDSVASLIHIQFI